MAETLVTILTAHLLADFIFQPNWMVKKKRNPGVLLLHVALVTVTSWVLLGTLHWPILAIIFLTHLVMDAIKAYLMQDTLTPFLIDQCVHLGVLAGLACYYPDAAKGGWWGRVFDAETLPWYYAALSFVSGLILVVPVGGMLVEKATRRFMDEIGENAIDGLTCGGRYIGYLERSLVMLLVFIDQPTGIGFLIAAKSILRFGEIKDAGQRKVAEYIIIGTFMSFGWALLISVVTLLAVQIWLPEDALASP